MKCPLNNQYERDEHGETTPVFGDCLKEECAWWQKEIGNCIIYQAGMELGCLVCFLEEISKKLPHPPAPKH